MNTGLENLAWGLAEQGFKVHIISGGTRPVSHDFVVPDGVEYTFTGVPGDNPASFIGPFHSLCNKISIDFVVGWIINLSLLINHKADKKLQFVANVGQMPPKSLRLRLLKFVLEGKLNAREAYQLFGAIKSNIAKFSAFVSISNAAQHATINYYKIDPQYCHVIHRGIDTNTYSFRRREKIDHEPIDLLFAGNIHPQKGVSDIVHSLKYIKSPVVLNLCGKVQGAYLNKINAQIQSIGHRLNYLGALSSLELAKNYQKCDIFVFPSYSEGLGKVLLEAMSCGSPVICSDIPAFKDIVIDKTNGLMVPIKSPDKIADAINYYLSQTTDVGQYSQNARKTVEDHFSRQIEILKWMRLLHELKS